MTWCDVSCQRGFSKRERVQVGIGYVEPGFSLLFLIRKVYPKLTLIPSRTYGDTTNCSTGTLKP